MSFTPILSADRTRLVAAGDGDAACKRIAATMRLASQLTRSAHSQVELFQAVSMTNRAASNVIESPKLATAAWKTDVQNAIVAYAAGVAAGCHPDDVIRVLGELKGVAGRLERVANTRHLNVFVDYAHTDDALRSILGMLDGIRREMRTHTGTVDTHAKIITVFGCGGDRDRGKRPLMMRAALDGSDEVILTSDNPRTEDPERILDDAMAAVSTAEHVKVRRHVDRRTAIGKAIELARPGDVVLIAGKGHETTQTIGTVKHPFSDANVAREIMEGKV